MLFGLRAALHLEPSPELRRAEGEEELSARGTTFSWDENSSSKGKSPEASAASAASTASLRRHRGASGQEGGKERVPVSLLTACMHVSAVAAAHIAWRGLAQTHVTSAATLSRSVFVPFPV